jgi:hypothetical protein
VVELKAPPAGEIVQVTPAGSLVVAVSAIGCASVTAARAGATATVTSELLEDDEPPPPPLPPPQPDSTTRIKTATDL